MDNALEYPGVPGPSNTRVAISGANAQSTVQEQCENEGDSRSEPC